MQKKLLTELLYDLEQEMIRLGYSQGSMQFYRRQWNKLLQFAEERGESFYMRTKLRGLPRRWSVPHVFPKERNEASVACPRL